MNRIAWPKLKFRSALPLTDRAFARLCRWNPDFRLERTAQGELLIMPPAGGDSAYRNSLLNTRLQNWAEKTGTGVVFDSSGGFTLPNGAIRSPDASWLALDRWQALTDDERAGFLPLCPDFVAELRSRSDPLREVRAKMREYRAQGARLGWLIDPKRGVVEVYRSGQRVEILSNPSALSGETVLPGFTLDLKGILTT
jgi:Uma2 family endonuclease